MPKSVAEKFRELADQSQVQDSDSSYQKVLRQCKADAESGYKMSVCLVPSMFAKEVLMLLHQDEFKVNVSKCTDFNETFYISWK